MSSKWLYSDNDQRSPRCPSARTPWHVHYITSGIVMIALSIISPGVHVVGKAKKFTQNWWPEESRTTNLEQGLCNDEEVWWAPGGNTNGVMDR